jgi:hypothetical protein
MQVLSAARYHLVDQAAALVPERQRAVFLGHVRAALAAEPALSDRRFKHVLCDVLSRFGIGLRPTFFDEQPRGRGNPMQRVQWRTVRPGHEKEDQAFNEHLADKVLCAEAVDDVVIALDQIGWRIVNDSGERWPMICRNTLTPSWCISIAEQDRDARYGAAIAVQIERRRPSHVSGQRPLSRGAGPTARF